jgi:DNA-binding MarR family transcriptional regulator
MPDLQKILKMIANANRVSRRIEQAICETQICYPTLSTTAFAILVQLYNDESSTGRDLQEAAGISQGTLSTALKRLEEGKYIEEVKTKDPDQRKRHFRVTSVFKLIFRDFMSSIEGNIRRKPRPARTSSVPTGSPGARLKKTPKANRSPAPSPRMPEASDPTPAPVIVSLAVAEPEQCVAVVPAAEAPVASEQSLELTSKPAQIPAATGRKGRKRPEESDAQTSFF